METLQASISAIKATRSFKKREELTVYQFIKKDLQSITTEEINGTLKTLCELGVIENTPSNDKSSYFIIDIKDSQPHIPKIMVTPIIEKKTHLLKFCHLLLKMKLSLSLAVMLRMIMIVQRHQTLLTVHIKIISTEKLKIS